MSTVDPKAATLPAPDDAPQNSLLLPSLEIKNFRAFRHLTIPKLGRVNLITGKNNVGKSSVLEAIRLYARRNPFPLLRNLLLSRNEFRPAPTPRNGAREAMEPSLFNGDFSLNVRDATILGALFHGRRNPDTLEKFTDDISIGPHGAGENDVLKIFISRLLEEGSFTGGPSKDLEQHNAYEQDKGIFALFATFATYRGGMSVDELIEGAGNYEFRLIVKPSLHCLYIPVDGLISSDVGLYWDKVSLTERESDVVDALKLITHDLQRINLIGEETGSRYVGRVPVVKLARFDVPVPLRSLGDGVNRLFNLALVLTNAENGILLVDEIENGLHYSALPDVWRLIFQTAKRLNVQVFATTHSWDCIEAFQQAASEDEDPNSGVLVRLQREDDGDVTATVFDERRLAIVTRDGIEVR